MRCGVIGAGSWGTALAMQLARSGDEVWLWSRDSDHADQIDTSRENARYLPGVRLLDGMRCSADLSAVLDGAQVVIEAVPSQVVRQVMLEAGPLMEPLLARSLV